MHRNSLPVCLPPFLLLYASCLPFSGFWPVHKLSNLHYEWQWRELTRLLVFERHACDHTWNKDLQQWALAKALSLFIPPFPIAMGRFFFFFQAAHDLLRRWKKRVGLVGKRVDWGGCGLLLFSSLTSQVNPYYSGPWSLVTAAFRAFAIEGLFISWLLVYQIILSGSDKIIKIVILNFTRWA